MTPEDASGGTAPGVTRQFPPAGQTAPAADFSLPAVGDPHRYALLVGLRVDSSHVRVVGLRVRYAVDGRTVTRLLPQDLTVCVDQPSSATSCPVA